VQQCAQALLVLADGLTVGHEAPVTLIAGKMKDYPVDVSNFRTQAVPGLAGATERRR